MPTRIAVEFSATHKEARRKGCVCVCMVCVWYCVCVVDWCDDWALVNLDWQPARMVSAYANTLFSLSTTTTLLFFFFAILTQLWSIHTHTQTLKIDRESTSPSPHTHTHTQTTKRSFFFVYSLSISLSLSVGSFGNQTFPHTHTLNAAFHCTDLIFAHCLMIRSDKQAVCTALVFFLADWPLLLLLLEVKKSVDATPQ